MKPLHILGMPSYSDRRDALLDMGVSPGEDDSYDVQARKMFEYKDQLADNTKRGVLQRIESMIQTNRQRSAPEGPLNPIDFIKETLAKSVPSPSEVNPVNIIKSIPAIAGGALEIAKHPLATAKAIALNGPPEPTTLAAMLLPGAALKTYRELAPLEARTYLHHMAGIRTPFNHVNEKERELLIQIGQEKIDKLLRMQNRIDYVNAKNARHLNNLRFMPEKDLLEYAEGLDLQVPSEAVHNYPKVRRDLISQFKNNGMYQRESLKSREYLGDVNDNKNVMEDFKRLTGKPINSFQVYPTSGVDDFTVALGKTYIEPMIDKATGKVIPKSVKDTYRFYPDVYSFDKGQEISRTKSLLKELMSVLKAGNQKSHRLDKFFNVNRRKEEVTNIHDTFKQIFSTNAHEPLGIVLRKLGMARPTSIIDIPLQSPAKMNAYDKAAILLGAKQASEKRK